MAFPQTAAPTESTFAGGGTTHNVSMPATVDSGDLLLAFLSFDNFPDIVTPSGWTQLWHVDNGTVGVGAGYAIVADGTEGGTTVNFATDISIRGVAQVYRVTAWRGALTGVEVGTAATGLDASPDPPSLTASWGAEDNLWIVVSSAADDAETFSAAPTNYTNLVDTVIAVDGGNDAASIGSARRENAAATDNPDAFTVSATAGWVANTVVVRPAAAANVTVTPGQGNLTLSAVAPTVTVTGNQTVAPGQGNLTLSTAAPTLARTGNVIAKPAQGNLVLSTVAPAVMSSLLVAVPQGNLVLSAAAPTLAITGNVIAKPSAGQLALTGAAPTIPLSSPRTFASQTLEAPLYFPEPVKHRWLIAFAANQAIRGKTNNVGEVTLTASATTTVVKDRRVGKGSFILYMPLTATAGGEVGMWTSNIGDETGGIPSFTINHALDARTNRRFRYIIVG